MSEREDWLAAAARARDALSEDGVAPYVRDHRVELADRATEAILGPLPPEPAPEWRAAEGLELARVGCRHGYVRVRAKGCATSLAPDDADAMADALRDCARWLRENGGVS